MAIHSPHFLYKYKWTWGVISLVPLTNINMHYVLCDWDFENVGPELRERYTCYKTPHGWHGIDLHYFYYDKMIEALKEAECDEDYIRMTKKRKYATLEFQSVKEAKFWRDVACFLVKFQRRDKKWLSP